MPGASALLRPGPEERHLEAVPAQRRPGPPRGVTPEEGVHARPEHRFQGVCQQRLQEDSEENKGEDATDMNHSRGNVRDPVST